MSINVEQFVLSGTIKMEAATTLNGVSVIPVHGLPNDGFGDDGEAATLYITNDDYPLPFQFVAKYADGTTTADFTEWSKIVDITPPKDPIPYASIPSTVTATAA